MKIPLTQGTEVALKVLDSMMVPAFEYECPVHGQFTKYFIVAERAKEALEYTECGYPMGDSLCAGKARRIVTAVN